MGISWLEALAKFRYCMCKGTFTWDINLPFWGWGNVSGDLKLLTQRKHLMETPTAPWCRPFLPVYLTLQRSVGLLCNLSRRLVQWMSLVWSVFFSVILLNKTTTI